MRCVRSVRSVFVYLAVYVCLALPAGATELKVKVSDTLHHPSGDRSSAITYYLTRDAKRTEFGDATPSAHGLSKVKVHDCKTGNQYNIDSGAQTYTEILPGKLTAEEMLKAVESAEGKSGRGVPVPTSTVEIETKDTGERQSFFGYTARHVITTIKRQAFDEVSDGWYIDLPVATECHVPLFTDVSVQQALDLRKTSMEVYRMIGEVETGFPVALRTTEHLHFRRPDGSHEESIIPKRELKVTEISDAPLDRSLFAVPRGFRMLRRARANPPIPQELFRRVEETH